MKPELRKLLQAIADEVVEILAEKDDAYGSSWKAHGGFSAFFNLDRKYSRIENMAEGQNYDLFEAIQMEVDGPDALKDLIGYALLTLSETYSPGNGIEVEEIPPKPNPDRLHKVAELDVTLSDGGEPGKEYVDQD